MSNDIPERFEILVHSAASTSKKEDDRLRAQALACLGFRPAKTTHLTEITFVNKQARLHKGSLSKPQKLRDSRRRRSREKGSHSEIETKVPHLKASQAAKYTSRVTKPTLLHSQGILENLKSTEHRELQTLLSQATNIEISSLTRRELCTPHKAEAEVLGSYATSLFDSWESPPASIPDPQSFLYEPPSAIQSSPEAGAQEQNSPVKSIFHTLSRTSFCYAPPAPSFGSLSRPPSNLENSYALSEYSLTSLHSASCPVSPCLPDFDTSFSLRVLVDEPYELFSPTPPTSSNPPLVTPQLRDITVVGDGKMMVEKYQKLKKSQTRDLRVWERGYWSVDTSSWEDAKSKIHFWTMLKDHIIKGRLGQVSVFLNDQVVKVYCFGGMAEHLWCALFIMSSRNLKNAIWVDAAENEIIRF